MDGKDSESVDLSINFEFKINEGMKLDDIIANLITKLSLASKIKKAYLVNTLSVFKHQSYPQIKMVNSLDDVVAEFEDYAHQFHIYGNKIIGFPKIDYDDEYYSFDDDEPYVEISELDEDDCQELGDQLHIAYPKAKFIRK